MNSGILEKIILKDIDKKLSFLLGALIGCIAFIGVYGTKVLDPTYDDWLKCLLPDLTQHYVGWELYRASGWHFPIGLCDTSCYPNLSSIIYTDSIPLLCVFFKMLSPVLPETFQFMGVYGIFCFAMQGGCAKLLLRRFFKSEICLNILVLPFVFCIPFMQRMFYHTALASHYLILCAFILFFYRDRIESLKKRITYWCILGAVCISIHFTIYGIVSLMMLFFSIYDGILEGKGIKGIIKTVVKYLTVYLAFTVLLFFMLGGFYGDISGDAFGLGVYSANLNAFFDPRQFSKIIKGFPGFQTQSEGFGYIGIAVMICFIPAIFSFAGNIKKIKRENRYLLFSLTAACLLSFAIALSPQVTFNDKFLFFVHLPQGIYELWSVFRASGRFIWPVMYAVILFTLVYLERFFNQISWRGVFIITLFGLMVAQLYEFSDTFRQWYGWYGDRKETHFSAEKLCDVDLTGIKHIQFMCNYEADDWYYSTARNTVTGYSELALKNGMTVSNFLLARGDTSGVDEQIKVSLNELITGNPSADTLYVFEKNQDYETIKEYILSDNMYEIDTGTEIVLRVR